MGSSCFFFEYVWTPEKNRHQNRLKSPQIGQALGALGFLGFLGCIKLEKSDLPPRPPPPPHSKRIRLGELQVVGSLLQVFRVCLLVLVD